MTNEMKNVPELRFPEFDGDWEEKKLKDISNKGMYGIGASATEFDGENVYVRITDINESSRKINNDKLTSPDRLGKKYLLNENDVLFARTGASTGKTYIHKNYDRDKNYYFAGFLIKFEFKNNYLANFIYQNTLTKRFENWVSIMSVRSGQPGINSEEYGKLKMRFPSKVEQNKIGDFFSKLDRQIELEEQKLAKLEEQKKGYMQKVFSQELRFKDENGNDYPEWVEETIPQIIQLITDYVANGSFAAIRENVTYSSVEDYAYVIRLQDASANWKGPFVYTNENAYDFLKKTSLFENDIIMSNVGTVGKFFKVPKMDKPMTLGPNALLFRSESNDMNFLYFYLNSKFFKKKLKRIITPGVQSKVNKTDLKKIAIKMPKLKEQEKIGDFFSRLDEIISKQSQKIGEMKLRKKGFLQKMFI